jgi:hypothetical protein
LRRDDLRHVLVDQRFATGQRDHGGAAFIDGAQRVLDAHAGFEDVFGLIDLPAAGAGQVALEQRFQHQNQRIALHAAQLAPGDVASHPIGL